MASVWDTLVDSNTTTIRTEYSKVVERLTFVWGTTNSYTRTRTIITDEYVGVTQTAAQTYADTHAGDSDIADIHIERMNPAAAYKVVKTTDDRSAYTLDT